MTDVFEEWRDVVGYEGLFRVSSLGRVLCVSTNRIRKAKIHGPYRRVNLYKSGVRTPHRIHVLVATAFHGVGAPLLEVRHLDGDSLNNLVSNLKWGTRSDNHQDTVAHGRNFQAKKTHCPKGHAYTEANTRRYAQRRFCRACDRARR